MTADRSRIPEFYKLSIEERVRIVHERGLLSAADFRALSTGRHTLDLSSADKMIENVVGQALEGDVDLSFPPKGVRCEIVIPSAQVTSRG